MVDWNRSQKRINIDEIREYLDDVLGVSTTEYFIKTGVTLEEMVSRAQQIEREIDEVADAQIEQSLEFEK
tara:strand:+ start:382 stop:591 length:210 start_codon:yes stop_codon:yes gene_type:complete